MDKGHKTISYFLKSYSTITPLLYHTSYTKYITREQYIVRMSFLRAYIYSHIYNLLTFFTRDLRVLCVSLHWMTDMFHATTFSDRLTKFRLPASPLTTNSSPDTKSWDNWRYLPDHRDYDAKASVIWMSEYYWRMLRSFGNVVSNGGTPPSKLACLWQLVTFAGSESSGCHA